MHIRALKNIDAAFLQSLLDNAVRETKHLEYKAQVPDDNVKFLAEVTAFANSQGGIILIGVEEDRDTGAAKSISGVSAENPDQEVLRIEQIIRNGSEPRIRGIEIKPISWNDRYVYCVWIPKSWNAPHRVTLKDHSKFYSRNSAGKYPMDVFELRDAFLQSEEIPNRIRSFKNQRIEKLINRYELPVALYDRTPLLVMHLMPISSFVNRQNLELRNRDTSNLPPISSSLSGWNDCFNIDGIVTFPLEIGKEQYSYTQLFRNGVIEAVSALIAHQPDPTHSFIIDTRYEENLIKVLSRYFAYYSSVEVDTPIYCFITLTGVIHSELNYDSNYHRLRLYGKQKCDRSVISLPEIVIEDMSLPAHTLLKPCFDLIWNAYGFSRSMNYDEEGNWVPQR